MKIQRSPWKCTQGRRFHGGKFVKWCARPQTVHGTRVMGRDHTVRWVHLGSFYIEVGGV